jgi:hypothetical protein
MATRRNYQRKKNGNDSPLHVLPVVADLIDYTLNLTDNAKHFPKKVRFTIVNRIQERVLSIYENLLEANEIFPIRNDSDKAKRLELQRAALTDCKLLLFYVELSKKRGYIDTGTFEYWTKKVLDVKYMSAAWYKSELEDGQKPPASQDESQA